MKSERFLPGAFWLAAQPTTDTTRLGNTDVAWLVGAAILSLVLLWIGFFWEPWKRKRLPSLSRSEKAPTKQFDTSTVYTCEALHVHNVTSLHSGGCCEYCHANPHAMILAHVVAADQQFMAEMCCRTYHDLNVAGRIAPERVE